MTTPVILPPERAGEVGPNATLTLPDGSLMIIPAAPVEDSDANADPFGLALTGAPPLTMTAAVTVGDDGIGEVRGIPVNLEALNPLFRQFVVEHLVKLPLAAAAVLSAFGVRVDGYEQVEVNDIPVAGFYDPATRVVNVSDIGYADERVRAQMLMGDAPLLSHELGHAFDHSLGWQSLSEEFIPIWEEALDGHPTEGNYYAESVEGLSSTPQVEMFAEAAAHVWNGTEPASFTLTPALRTVVNALDDPAYSMVAAALAFDEGDHPRDEDGRFTDGDGGLPDGWRASEPSSDDFAVTWRNGDAAVSITPDAQEKVPTEVQHAILSKVAELQDKDPLSTEGLQHTLRVNIVTPQEMRTKGAGGATYSTPAGSVIELNAGVMDPESPTPRGDTVAKKLPDVAHHDYVMTHEYGHALQSAIDADRGSTKFDRERTKLMRNNERPSAYGDIKLTDKYEAYAEAYSDWRLSDKPGPLAVALAEHDGWGAR